MAEKPLRTLVSDPEHFLVLEPEELAGVLLVWLDSLTISGFYHTLFTEETVLAGYPEEYAERMRRAMMEAWVWMEREGLIAPEAGWMNRMFITRKGLRVIQTGDISAYQRANLLPRGILHPVMAQKVFGAFLRGDYDTAVFQAFKEVEVAVRKAAGYSDTEFGVAMMRKAFHTESGPLRDPGTVTAERQGLLELFAGATGAYKNPHSHRSVKIDAEEASELITMASHLLKIVDARSPPKP